MPGEKKTVTIETAKGKLKRWSCVGTERLEYK